MLVCGRQVLAVGAAVDTRARCLTQLSTAWPERVGGVVGGGGAVAVSVGLVSSAAGARVALWSVWRWSS